MAKYEVEGPDGSKYEVEMPEGLSPEAMRVKLEETFSALGIKANRVDTTAGKFAAPGVAPKYPGLDFSQPVPQVRAAIQAMPEADRKGAFNEWAKQYVAKERQGGGIMQGVRDFGRNLARGTPVGSWLDEANAKTANMISGTPYDEALAYQRATDAAIDSESTRLGSLPLIGDVTAGGVQKLAGGIASAPVSPMVNMMRGGTMLPRVVNAGATGAVYGGAYGAGEGDTSGERMVNATVGAGIGLGLGAAMPPIAEGVGRLMKRQAQPQGPLAGMNREAVDFVGDAMRADRVTQVPDRLQYPETMIGDLGPNLQGYTGAIARSPGEGQTIVKQAVGATVGEGRRGGAAGRITGAVDEAMGPAQNLIQLEDEVMRQSRAAARPYYEQFSNTPVQPTPRLQQYLDFAREKGIDKVAQEKMQREALINPDTPVSPNMMLEYIKREFDRLADYSGTATGGLNRDAAIDYRRLAAGFREEVDDILIRQDAASRGVPVEQGISSWQEARARAGTGLQFRDGLEQGADAFKKGINPDQMRADRSQLVQEGMPRGTSLIDMETQLGTMQKRADELAKTIKQSGYNVDVLRGPQAPNSGLTRDGQRIVAAANELDGLTAGITDLQQRVQLMSRGPGITAYDVGARGAIRDIAGNQGTMFGPTGDSAVMKALGSDYAREKLRIVAGDDKAKRLINRLGAEGTYEQTRMASVGNSVTAAMTEAMKRLDKKSSVNSALEPTIGLTGMVKQFTRAVINKMTAGHLDEKARDVAIDAARILTAQGPERDAYIRELTSFINRRDITARRRNAATALLEAIGAGARAPAIENASIGGESRL